MDQSMNDFQERLYLIFAGINQLEVSFFVYQNNDSVKVNYYGIRPDLFKDDAEVVVSGSFNNSLISATELQTKCASRYEGDLKNIEKI